MSRADGTARAVFLDRDGVLNRSIVRDGRPYAPTRLEEFELLPGVLDATRALRRAGFLLIVVTNQPDVGAGLQQQQAVERMNAELLKWLPLNDIKVCYHVDADGCACRKPKPGMIIEAAGQWGIDLPASVMVGDRWRDIEAGQAAHCRTVFVDGGYSERSAAHPADAVASSLDEAARLIIDGIMWRLETHD
jgi:D-glycero-D-manno-heptose 1,7-bisphosphate phosphatase